MAILRIVMLCCIAGTFICSAGNNVSCAGNKETAYELEREYWKNRSDLSDEQRLRKMINAYDSRYPTQPFSWKDLLKLIIPALIAGGLYFLYKKISYTCHLKELRFRYSNKLTNFLLGRGVALVIDDNKVLGEDEKLIILSKSNGLEKISIKSIAYTKIDINKAFEISHGKCETLLLKFFIKGENIQLTKHTYGFPLEQKEEVIKFEKSLRSCSEFHPTTEFEN